MDAACQVEFYVPAGPKPDGEVACELAMAAWEAGHRVLVRVASEEDARRLDERMWDYPAGRFLPHARGAVAANAPIGIESAGEKVHGERDLLINLSPEPATDLARFSRLLEIVPADPGLRETSRGKFRSYRELGLNPATHTMD